MIITVKILSIETDYLEQTMQTQLRSLGYETFSMLTSAEHEILIISIIKYQIIQHFWAQISPEYLTPLLINDKMPTFAGILTFISRTNSCSAELSMIIFITSGSDYSYMIRVITSSFFWLNTALIYETILNKFYTSQLLNFLRSVTIYR